MFREPKNIHEIETPAVLIDLDVLDRNLQKMASYCEMYNLSLRPHTKTHKTPQIAHLQIKYGAPGITVAKLGEAEVMADAGIADIVVVYPLWGESKWRRLAELAQRLRIAVSMDSLEVAEGISAAAKEAGAEVGIRLEFDTGFHRCGLPLNAGSMDTACRIMALPNIRWEGISVYPGHIMSNRVIREQEIPAESLTMDRLYQLLDAAGIPYPIVSGGNTPAAFESHRFRGVNEIRPGTYVFNDRNTVDAEAAGYTDCAATVLTTVVSTSVRGRAIIDAGSKTLTADSLESGDRRYYGYIQDRPDLILENLSEEHGHLKTEDSSSITVGEKLRVIPNHICPCINLHDSVYIVSGENIVDQWKVAARGKVA
jgi:D-serine deaminase-like pyridoxal phosphate-dependent protein